VVVIVVVLGAALIASFKLLLGLPLFFSLGGRWHAENPA